MGSWPASRVVWQRRRSQRLHSADGRGTRRDGVYRPPLQRADRGSRERAWHDPSPLVPMASGAMDRAEFTAFLRQTCCNLATFSAAGSLHYLCMDWRHLAELLAAVQEVYGEFKNLCVWIKDNAGMGSLYRSQHELVLVFKQRGGAHRNNVQLGRFGRHRSNVWHYPGANSFARC